MDFITAFGTACGATGWLMELNGYLLGVYPSTDYSALSSSANDFTVGAEVFDETSTWIVPMGTGSSSTAPGAQTAFFNAPNPTCGETGIGSGVVANGTTFNCSFDTPSSTVSNYTVQEDGNGDTFYGDAVDVWWGANYGFAYSPIGDWAPWNYKGECPNIPANSMTHGIAEGQPISGISASTNASFSHGLLCGQVGIPPTGTCYDRALGSSDNRGDTDSGSNFSGHGGDWDYGFTKDECNAGEYVQGVSQGSGQGGTTSGYFDGILCCPGNVTHQICTSQAFGTGNSPAYGIGPDWDPGFYKGVCPTGQYVAGVSRTTSNAVHAILCCSP
jgi:hypothetical protein